MASKNGRINKELGCRNLILSKVSWLDKESTFASRPLQLIINELERQYNVSVDASKVDTNQLFTGSFTNSATWSVVHNLNSDYPSITVWNSSRDVVIPTRINSVDANNVNVYFSSAQTGKVVIVKGL